MLNTRASTRKKPVGTRKTPGAPPIILLADDHRLVAEGLQGLLSPEFKVAEIVEDGRMLLAANLRLKPDVVITDIGELKVVINGAGAAGLAISKLLMCHEIDRTVCTPVQQIVMCDTKGIIHKDRSDLNDFKREILKYTNPFNTKGTLKTALKNADVFIGVSMANQLTTEDVMTMNKKPIIFPLANPIPEISPEKAYKGGAGVVGTGRSDVPNQINNVLAFPGIFRGALDIRARRITPRMKVAAAYAIADCVTDLHRDNIIPSTLDLNVAKSVAQAVKDAYLEDIKHMETPKHAL